MNTRVFRGEYTPHTIPHPWPTGPTHHDLPTRPAMQTGTHPTQRALRRQLSARGPPRRSRPSRSPCPTSRPSARSSRSHVFLLFEWKVSRSFANFPWNFVVVCSKLVSKYVFRPPPQPPAVLNTCICSFSEPHFEYTEYVFRM